MLGSTAGPTLSIILFTYWHGYGTRGLSDEELWPVVVQGWFRVLVEGWLFNSALLVVVQPLIQRCSGGSSVLGGSPCRRCLAPYFLLRKQCEALRSWDVCVRWGRDAKAPSWFRVSGDAEAPLLQPLPSVGGLDRPHSF